MSAGIRGRWITRLEEFAALAPAWDAALEAAGSDTPFLLSEFLLAWCRAFLPPGGLRVLVVENDGALVGGLPLYAARRAPGVGVLRMVGCGFANWTEPFGGVPAHAAMGEALAALPGWRYLSLPLARAPLAAGLPERWRTGLNASIRMEPGWRSPGDYLATRPAKLQANLRRLLRLTPDAQLRRETEPAALARLIDFQLRHNGPDRYPPDRVVSGSRAAWAAFTRDLLQTLAASGRLDAMALRIGGDVVAAGFGYRYGPGGNSGYKSMLISHDPRWRRQGPGYLFFYHLIGWCLAHGDPELNMFALTAEKRRWCNTFTPLYATRVFPPTWMGRLLAHCTR